MPNLLFKMKTVLKLSDFCETQTVREHFCKAISYRVSPGQKVTGQNHIYDLSDGLRQSVDYTESFSKCLGICSF